MMSLVKSQISTTTYDPVTTKHLSKVYDDFRVSVRGSKYEASVKSQNTRQPPPPTSLTLLGSDAASKG